VGIGITNPGHILDVNGSVGIRGYTYSRLFYSFYHQSGILSSAQTYAISGSQFNPASGSGAVDDGWYHVVAMRFDSNPFERSTCAIWYFGEFAHVINSYSFGLPLSTDGNLNLTIDTDAVNYATPYMVHLHKYGGRDT